MRIRKAFTLLELLIVIGIIAVILAFLLPALNRAREQARQVVCASNERQILMACFSYADDNKGWMPLPIPSGFSPFPNYNYAAISSTGFGQYNWTEGTLWPYVGGSPLSRQRVFNCPSDDPDPRPSGYPPDQTRPRNFSYNLNAQLIVRPPSPVFPATGMRLTQIVHPSHKILVMEMQYPVGSGGGVDAIVESMKVTPLLTTRHSGMANEGMADGHVETFDPGIFDGTTSSQPAGPLGTWNGVMIFNNAYYHFYSLTDSR